MTAQEGAPTLAPTELPWPVHPAAETFDLLTGAELQALADDIRAHGLHEPVWLWDDPTRGTVLLDGRNRARACALAGVDITEHVRWYAGTRPLAFVLSENFYRRHVSVQKRISVTLGARDELRAEREADDLRAAAEEDARRRMAEARRRLGDAARAAAADDVDDEPETITRVCIDAHPCDPLPELEPEPTPPPKPRRAADDIADVAGVSGRSVAQYLRVQEQAPDLIAKVDADEMSLAEAEKELRHRNRVTEQRERDLAEQQARAQPGGATIDEADCIDWFPTAPTADLLLTDPPYSTDVDDVAAFAREWLPAALAKVKPTGRAYVCIGAYPDELLAYLSAPRADMYLADVLVWTYRNTIGPSSKLDYSRNWQAILHFRGPDAPPLGTTSLTEKFAVIDMNAPDGRRGERWHAWQKPDELGELFARHATEPGGVVLDPFAGTGTFLLAAARLGRRAHGADRDPEMVAIAKERGCE